MDEPAPLLLTARAAAMEAVFKASSSLSLYNFVSIFQSIAEMTLAGNSISVFSLLSALIFISFFCGNSFLNLLKYTRII